MDIECIRCGRNRQNYAKGMCRSCWQQEWRKSSEKGVICARRNRIKKVAKNRDEAREFIREMKTRQGCCDCGNTDHRVLDFDHTGEKKYNISRMVGRGNSLLSIKKEICKCEIRCSNCHRIKTLDRIELNSVPMYN